MFKYVYMYIYVNIYFLSQSVYINSVYRPHISHIYHVCVQTKRKNENNVVLKDTKMLKVVITLVITNNH